ncbi:magnesium transporter CorA family protein [Asticcacaulis sp. AC402]|uniref:magnesium transporter CorA family protein n=1 Tax=Asticcacaulis sp. AC402 TaxID=1282361 RepID=UPI0003C404F7|nr:magnesium transporter CorA family protein [Asticcacaulis sp. AC402]ESQ73737.1 magnesium transporter CorA [Asticcacaulis sp. AC402]
MIRVFHFPAGGSGKIAETQIDATHTVPDEPVWIDLVNPTEEEERNLPQNLNIALPRQDEIWRNHALNRMYTRDGISYMTAVMLCDVDSGTPRTSPVTFILTPDFLITIRRIDPTSFLSFSENLLLRPKRYPTSADVLEGLLEEIITRVATRHKDVIKGLDVLSQRIFNDQAFDSRHGDPSILMRGVLKRLGYLADLNSKINESVHSLQRLLAYFKDDHNHGNPVLNRDVERMIKDCRSLTEQSGFANNQISFHLETSLGMINVEQNLIAKIFSVVALIFLPPSLVVGYFGMNFHNMPEFSLSWGQPLAIGLMLVFAVVPYLWFKRKRWL